jgi:hypothetical protein
VLFAGEHLADWQGFMEGAVVTGEEAAKALTGKSRMKVERITSTNDVALDQALQI